MKHFALVLVLMTLICKLAVADPTPLDNTYVEPEATAWKESDYRMPPFPKDENLIEFDAGPTANGKYYIDKTSISVGGTDGVVRYVMVVKSAGGATNISFEGLHCSVDEMQLYATGTSEGTWSKSRKAEWRHFKLYNKAQIALANYYFCPDNSAISTAAEGLNALKLGANPVVTRRTYQ